MRFMCLTAIAWQYIDMSISELREPGRQELLQSGRWNLPMPNAVVCTLRSSPQASGTTERRTLTRNNFAPETSDFHAYRACASWIYPEYNRRAADISALSRLISLCC